MPSNTDVMIEVEANLEQVLKDFSKLEESIKKTQSTVKDQLSPSTDTLGGKMQNLGGRISGLGNTIKQKLGTEGALAFAALGTAALSFSKKCIDAAVKSESEWTRFGALVNSNGGNWSSEEGKVKKWAKTFSNNMGYAVSDTREASMALMQFGVKSSELEGAMKGVAGVAARTGMTEAEASNMVISALNGRGMQLQKLTGLRIDDYKQADGQIDRERLLNDLYEQNKDAIEAHGQTTEAQLQRMTNSWNSFKTSIGQALMPVVKILADVVGAIADGFANLPTPVKQVIALLVAIGGVIGVVVGALGFLAPVLTTIGGIISAIGTSGGIIAGITAAFPGLIAGLGVIASALSSLILPILLVVAAFMALAVIGKKLGWWNDLGGMIERLGQVLQQVVGAIMNFVSWFGKLFTDFPAAQQEFQAFIDNLGGIITSGLTNLAGMALTAVRNFIIGIADGITGGASSISDSVMGIADSIAQGLNGLIDSIASNLPDLPTILLTAWNFTPLGMIFNNLLPLVTPALMNFANGVVNYFRSMVMRAGAVFGFIVNYIRARLAQGVQVAGALVSQIRNAIVTRFNLIIARTRAIFGNIVNAIRQRLVSAVNAARQKAREIYNGILDRIRSLPGQVGTEISNLANTIKDKLVQAGLNAFNGAKQLVAQFLAGMGIHSPGIIQRSTAAEFSTLPGIIGNNMLNAASTVAEGARGVVGAWQNNMESLGVDYDVSSLEAANSLNYLQTMNTVDYDVSPLEASLETLARITVPISQFDTFNPTNMNGLTTSMAGTTTSTATMNNRILHDNRQTTNNDDHTVVYHIDEFKVNIDGEKLTENDKRNLVYEVLDGISGGIV